MKMIYIFLSLLFLVGCGARKTEKQQTKITETTEQKKTSINQTTEIDWQRQALYELLFTAVLKADTIEVKDGKTTFYGAELQTAGKTSESKEETAKTSQTDAVDVENTKTDLTENTNTKLTDKKQYNWWYGVPVLLLLIGSISFLIYIYRKK